MHFTIQNKTHARILLRFNSGVTRHLAPLEALRGVEPVEIKGNRRVLSLKNKNLITIEGAVEKATATEKKKSGGRPASSKATKS